MGSEVLGRVGVVAYAAWRGALAGGKGIALALVAAVYPLLVLAIASAHRNTIDLLAASETLYSLLFLPILLLLVCLVLGVGQFRGEIEDDTVVYPIMRSLPRPALVVGKFLGYVAAALVFLLPATLLGPVFALAFNAGPQVSSAGLGAALLVTTIVAVLAYGALFVLLGLLTRQALVIGLVYGFIWETFLPLLPGSLKEITLVYYLRGIGGDLVNAGPLLQTPQVVGLPTAIGVPLAFAFVALALGSLYIRDAELGAAPAPS
ncbi:MAG TPA: hypothetical protein VGV89_08370 [Thermoplasmata archaeon]|nr:hypothetical protein [Thermoplasmata archaeon]